MGEILVEIKREDEEGRGAKGKSKNHSQRQRVIHMIILERGGEEQSCPIFSLGG